MRHIRSILYALVLAPAAWVLTGVGLTGDLTARGRDGFAVENLAGLLLLLLAGAAYGILVLAPISPAGPLLAGAGYLAISVWALQSPSAYAAFWPPSVAKDGFDLSRPGYGLAALLAVPLISTALSARRWARYEPPVIPIIGQVGRARGAAAAYGTPLAVAQTTVIGGPGLDADPTTILRLPLITTSIVPGFGDDPTFSLAAATRNGHAAAIGDEPTVATVIEDEPTADVPASEFDGELTTGIVAGPDSAADDDPTEAVAGSDDEPTAVVSDASDEEPTAVVAAEETADVVVGDEPTAVSSDGEVVDDAPTPESAGEEPTATITDEETADVAGGDEPPGTIAGDIAADADSASAAVDDASIPDGSDDEPNDGIAAEKPGDEPEAAAGEDEPTTDMTANEGSEDEAGPEAVDAVPAEEDEDETTVVAAAVDAGDKPEAAGPADPADTDDEVAAEVIQLPVVDSGEKTQVLRPPVGGAAERTQVVRLPVGDAGERTQVLRLPAGGGNAGSEVVQLPVGDAGNEVVRLPVGDAADRDSVVRLPTGDARDRDSVVRLPIGDAEERTQVLSFPSVDSGEKTQVIKLPTAPSGDTTQVLRFPGRPAGFGPGERTRDLSTRATGDVGGDETQVIRLDSKAVDEERTQVIRPLLVTPPGQRTEVLKFPATAPPVPDDPPVSIANAEAPNFADDPTSPIILPTAAEDDEATEPGRRVMTVMNLERPPDEIADDTTHIEIPTQRRPSDDEA